MRPPPRMRLLPPRGRVLLAPRVQVAVADAEHLLAPIAVAGHRSVAVDAPFGVRAAVVDGAYSTAATTRPAAALLGLVHRAVSPAHDVFAHAAALLASLGVDLASVVDRVPVLGVQRVTVFVDAAPRIEGMRTRRGRVGVTADVVRLGPLWFQCGGNHGAAGKGDDPEAEPSDERAPAAALGKQRRSVLCCRLYSQLARLPSAISCSRRRAVSMSPSICSRLLTVPLA